MNEHLADVQGDLGIDVGGDRIVNATDLPLLLI